MKNYLSGKNMKLLAIIGFIIFSFYISPATGQTQGSIEVSKSITPKTDACNQFDVQLEITGIPTTRPIDVVIVIDRSTSMNKYSSLFNPTGANSIVKAKEAATNFAHEIYSMNSNNRVAVVSYGNTATSEINLTSLNNSANVYSKINTIQAGPYGWGAVQYTNIAAGFNVASNELINNSITDCNRIQAIVMLTDGVANRSPYHTGCDVTPTNHTDCTTDAI